MYKDWGTYVAVHMFVDRAMNRLMECCVKPLEQGFFMSERTMWKVAQKGIYAVLQMGGISPDLARNPLMLKALRKKFENFGRNLLKHKVKVVSASDCAGEFNGNPLKH